MAADIQLLFDSEENADVEGDFAYQNGDLVRENSLATAVMISLFTDRRASDDDVLDNPEDRRGWFGDLLPNRGDKIGSKLWQFERAKTDSATMLRIEQVIKDSLQWMLDDEVAKKIEVFLEKFGDAWNYRLGATIKIHRSFGDVESIKFNDLWNAQLGV